MRGSATADKDEDRAGINPHLNSDLKYNSNVFLTRENIYWRRSNKCCNSLRSLFTTSFFKN
jgi:hypothetical protein